MNQSKASLENKVQWKKWEDAGALEGMPEAKMRTVLEYPIRVDATGTSIVDGLGLAQTLSLGSKIVSQGIDWTVSQPVIAVVVRGDRFRPGDMVSRANLPRDVKPVERVYPRN